MSAPHEVAPCAGHDVLQEVLGLAISDVNESLSTYQVAALAVEVLTLLRMRMTAQDATTAKLRGVVNAMITGAEGVRDAYD